MTLRSINDPSDFSVLFPALQQTLPQGTLLASLASDSTGQNRIFDEDVEGLAQSPFPAVLVLPGKKSVKHAGEGFEGTQDIKVRYYDRWEQNAATLSTIRKNCYVELLRMASNLETNNSLASGGYSYIVSMTYDISDSPEEDDTTVPGLKLVYREMVIHMILMPWLTE